jgi:cyclopropane fatty-acyl-phospholipid synthase-like methyltransferase
MDSLPEHLGGHKGITHLDEGVLKYMQKILNVKTMLDVGCGPGGMVKLARKLGIEAYGIDGDFTVNREGNYFTIHDYTTGPSPLGDQKFDMVWSCEFVEHVEEKWIPYYIKDFQRGNFVVMTFSPKSGHHHVNVKPESYWIETFEKYGFHYDKNMTRQIKEVSTMNTTGKFITKQFVKQNGLCFVKL